MRSRRATASQETNRAAFQPAVGSMGMTDFPHRRSFGVKPSLLRFIQDFDGPDFGVIDLRGEGKQ